jgi:predicted transcriptional regulator
MMSMLTMRGHPPNERLKRLRVDILGMSLTEMAEELECCSRSSLHAYEKGTRNPGRAASLKIERLAEKARFPIAADEWP